MMKRLLFVSYFCISAIISFGQTKPIFYYPFNGDTIDESGNGNVCTNFGATLTTDRFGNENSAYYFDGTDDYMQIIPNIDVSSLGDFTLSLWFSQTSWKYSPKINSPDPTLIGMQYIFSGHAASLTGSTVSEGIGVCLKLKSDSTSAIMPYYHWGTEKPTSNRVVQLIDYSDLETWKHIVLIRKDGKDSVYVNGILNSQPIYYSNTPSDDKIDLQHPLYLGSFNASQTIKFNFHGKIDDIRIYNRALNSKEVSQLYQYNDIIRVY